MSEEPSLSPALYGANATALDGETQTGVAVAGNAFAGHDLVLVEHIGKTFGEKKALTDVSFCVPAGQICGLLGPNGAGKTTLFRLLMGILKATEGRVLVDGRDAFDDRVEVKRLIGFLPDEPVFYSYLSGREHLRLSAAMHGVDVDDAMARVEPLIARLRLAEDMDNYAEEYSRGMKKKLGLIMAMLHQPRPSRCCPACSARRTRWPVGRPSTA